MSETKYTLEQINVLMRADPSLARKETEKYTEYKSKDPFPKVGEALLNSVDLLMYLLKVGIVEPFDVNKLKGVTYQCTFSGEAHRFNQDSKRMEEINLDDTDELILEKNSITYLKIEEKFHVPEYMVLRFNLSVSNAYKGLLLGTGPIVDPGFEGNLFIPLHNLTGNEYVIKKGAPLIRVEFTKLSRHIEWENKKKNLFPLLKPITKSTPRNAIFSKFFESALLDSDDKKFFTNEDATSVRSSIPDMISSSAKQAEEAQKNAKTAADTVAAIQKKIRDWSVIGAVGAALTAIAIIISVFALIHDANSRYDSMAQDIKDCTYQINTLEQQLEVLQKKLDLYEMTQSISYEQHSGSTSAEESEEDASLSLRGEEINCGKP
ncbi:MAG: hypothetical protein K2O16_19850 [Lachnospiraceae bacterium]|nr:hypothetical protein [Lachnospiraceae bacterium]